MHKYAKTVGVAATAAPTADAIAPPPRYARQALVNATPLSPAKLEPTNATAIGPANAPAVATVTMAITAVMDKEVITVLRTSLSSFIRLS